MKFSGKINGSTCEMEIPDDIIAAIVPQDLNQKQAAQFCHMSTVKFRRLNVPKNANGKYSVAELTRRMEVSQ